MFKDQFVKMSRSQFHELLIGARKSSETFAQHEAPDPISFALSDRPTDRPTDGQINQLADSLNEMTTSVIFTTVYVTYWIQFLADCVGMADSLDV